MSETENEKSEKLLDAKAAAKFLGVSPSWVYQAVAKQDLDAYKVGRKLRFDLPMLKAWLAKQKTTLATMPSLGKG